VWFTLSHGIVNEIYHPRIDTAAIRDAGLLFSTEDGWFCEEKREARTELRWFAPGVPGYVVTNHLPRGLTVTKEIFTDPLRDVVIQRCRIEGGPEGMRVTALLAPHLDNHGDDNRAWVSEYRGHEMLFASGRDTVLAMATDVGWMNPSAGFVGVNDGWQDVESNGRLTWGYRQAGPGNVAIASEITVPASGEFAIAIAFGESQAEAGIRAHASLGADLDDTRDLYTEQWQAWQRNCRDAPSGGLVAASRTVLRVHESLSFPGATIASLSIPWGSSKGDDDLGGYHLVWPRDMVETLGGLLAAGAHDDVVRGLAYLRSTQDADGHWPQNMWLDGTPYWGGVQMDETALPILALGLALDHATGIEAAEYWPMVEAAAGFIVRNGPASAQDRWEEDAGYSPFTLAAEVAALVVAAGMADRGGRTETAAFLRETADVWNERIEDWTYVSGTPLADEVGVDGYYVRIGPSDTPGWGVDRITIKNREAWDSSAPAQAIVSPDALALVRFGLRSAADPRIQDTVKVIDHLLRDELSSGPVWHRYNGDGYGEHDDGAPFDGTGVGRPWPLLTGERAHFELAAGNLSVATGMLQTLERFAQPNGLLPEQVWDADDIPDRELFRGRPTGSAMPLAWAHAEYLKLAASLRAGQIFDMPTEVEQRFAATVTRPSVDIWDARAQIRMMAAGRGLRLQVREQSTIRWTSDDWRTMTDTETEPMLGLFSTTLDMADLEPGRVVEFAIHIGDRWEGTNHRVTVGAAPGTAGQRTPIQSSVSNPGAES
jgi:glucoamylase